MTSVAPAKWLTPVLLIIALLAIATPLALVHLAPAPPPRAVAKVAPKLPPRTVVPEAVLPSVEPVALADITPDDARAYNEAQPFAIGPIPPARAFRFAGAADELGRATDCLAAALIYEAGDDAMGEKAVAQVVLNRLRHPAFPKTICGVVFQGSERRTGCQFSFTCDGALARWHPTDASWTRARAIAAQALGGAVFRPVGLATHYHTDWVVPYWQSSLDKIARVETHLFFRWTGWWGTPPAFDRHPDGTEPVEAQLATLSEAHRSTVIPTDAATPLATGDSPVPALLPATTGAADDPELNDSRTFLATLPAGASPDGFPALAAHACGVLAYCKYLGWTALAGVPAALPITPRQQASMGFSYLRDRARGFEKALWNCGQFKRAILAQCMKPPLPLAAAAPEPPADAPSELSGVRRKIAPEPTPTPSARR